MLKMNYYFNDLVDTDLMIDNIEEIIGDGQQSVGSNLTAAVTQLNSSIVNYKSRTVQSKVAYNKSTTNTWYETNITPDTIQGYTAVGIAGFAFNVSNAIVYQLYWTGSSAHIGISRTSSNLSEVVFTLYFEYVKN